MRAIGPKETRPFRISLYTSRHRLSPRPHLFVFSGKPIRLHPPRQLCFIFGRHTVRRVAAVVMVPLLRRLHYLVRILSMWASALRLGGARLSSLGSVLPPSADSVCHSVIGNKKAYYRILSLYHLPRFVKDNIQFGTVEGKDRDWGAHSGQRFSDYARPQ